MPESLIIDIDGTLVDSNYQHVIAWQRAFRQHGFETEAWKVHRYVGKGGDKMVASVAGEKAEAESGDAIRESEGVIYRELIDDVTPFDGAAEFVASLKEQGLRVILASSAKQDEVGRYLDLLGVGETIDGFTTSADVDATKPEPDLVEAALEKAGSKDAAMIGDSIWDVEAAKRVGLECSAVLTGGFSKAELLAAGALQVQPSLADLDIRQLVKVGLT